MISKYDVPGSARRALLAPLTAFALLAALPACAQSGDAAAGQSAAAGGDEVVATIDGQNVTMSQLEAEAESGLDQIEAQLAQCERQAEASRYQALDAALQGMLRERMVAAEAAAAGQTPEEYLAAELESQVGEVTDADVEAFFAENQARIPPGRTQEELAPQIRQFLAQQKRTEAEQAFYSNLEAKHQVRSTLEPPRTEVAATGPAKGPESAPVTIVEFSDFECPFCSRVNPTLAQVRETYGDKVRIVFRQFPLAMHPNAQKAAEASLCAHDQGKFWEMHDAMFADQRNLGIPALKTKAETLSLDGEEFAQCLDSGEYADEVQADMQAGIAAGVNGTPAMFINGIPLSGAVPFENLAEVIDAELERKGVASGAASSSE